MGLLSRFFNNPSYTVGNGGHRSRGISVNALQQYFRTQTLESEFSLGTKRTVQDEMFRPLDASQVYSEPKISFASMIDAYENDPEIGFGIDFVTAISVGMGHHYSAESANLVDYVTDFAEDANLDEVAILAGRESLAYGNSIWTYKDISADQKTFETMQVLPLTSLRRLWWNGTDPGATVGYYEFKNGSRMLPSELIHFRWRISNGYPFGLGLLAPIVSRVRYTYTRNGTDEQRIRMSLLDIKRSMQDSAHKIMKRYINRNVYNAKNASPAQVVSMQGQLDALEDEQDFVVDGELDIKELGTANRTIDLEGFERLYSNEIIKALGTPTSRLYERGSLTEASAKSAKEVALMNLAGFQRQMKRNFERLILKPWYLSNPKTDANGVVIPWKLAKIRLHWGMQEKPQMGVAELANLLAVSPPGTMSMEEIRNYLSEGGIKLNPATITDGTIQMKDKPFVPNPDNTNRAPLPQNQLKSLNAQLLGKKKEN